MPQVDSLANAPIVIDTVHAHIHYGRAFFASDVRTVVDTGISRAIIDVASGASAHIDFEIKTEGRAISTLKEVGSYSNATSFATINRNLFSDIVPDVSVLFGGSLEVTSASLFRGLIGSGDKNNNVGGGVGGAFYELILKPGIYALDVQNLSGSTNYVAIEVDWYEPKK